MKNKDKRIASLKEQVPHISAIEVNAKLADGGVVLDVRDADEVSQGSPHNAVRVGRSYLELNIENHITDFDAPVYVMCAGGLRSLFAADSLQQLGYKKVYSIIGGFNQWKNDGLSFEVPQTLTADARERYARHILMPNVGEAGQLKLLNAKVLCIGAGGLGSPIALYLAAAGVGTIGIVDDDVVDKSNLQRQILHNENTLGIPKAESARQTLEALNSSIKINTYQQRINASNVEELLKDYDIVVDGSDNIPTRYLINDTCVKYKIPNVHGAIFRFEGQVTVFWPGDENSNGPCYRCLFSEPAQDEALSCAAAGVLGVLPGVIGVLQAIEVVKLIIGIGRPLVGRMLYYDALDASFRELKMKHHPKCKVCGH